MSAITSPIIFALGATGVSKFRGDMMIAVGAIAAVAKVIADGIKEANDFAIKMNALDTASRKMALSMDAAAKGIINTADTFTIMSQMQQAGVKTSNELAKAIGTTIADAAAKFNWSIETATEKAHKLAEGISKGSTRALKEYGIDLVNTEDLLLAQAEATEKLIERSKDLRPELKSAGQLWDALGNSLSTARGYMFDLGGNGIPVVSDALNGMNSILMDSVSAFEDIKTVLENTDFTVWEVGIAKLMNQLGALSDAQYAMMLGRIKGQSIAAGPASVFETGGPEAEPLEGTFMDYRAELGGGKGLTKKGGGGRKSVDEMTFTLEETQTAWMDIFLIEDKVRVLDEKREESLRVQAEILGDQIAGYADDILQTNTEIWQQELAAEDEARRYSQEREEWRINEAGGRQAMWAAELEQERISEEYERARHEWRMEAMGIEQERRVSDFEAALGIEQAALQQSRDMWAAGLQQKMQLLGGMLSGWSALMMSENKKAFAFGKAAAISETIINTIAGSIAAYKAMAGIPYVGPALGIIAAAGVTAAGTVAVQKIAATKFGGGAKGVGSPSMSGGGGTGPSSTSGMGGGGGDQSINVTVTVPLDGEVIYENQQAHNYRATREGRPAFGWAA